MKVSGATGRGALASRFERHTAALNLALQAGDDVAVRLAASQLRFALRKAARTALLDRDHTGALVLLRAAGDVGSLRPVERGSRVHWNDAGRLVGCANGIASIVDKTTGEPTPDVRDVNVSGMDLHEMTLSRLHVANTSFAAANLLRAAFDGSVLDGCDFSRANLGHTTWRSATLTASSFCATSMIDVALEGAAFIDCDLRGADLYAIERGAQVRMTGASFIRCDLRETNWTGRSLADVKMIACKLYGAHGRPDQTGVEIVHPDVSPHGDGSMVVTDADSRQLFQI